MFKKNSWIVALLLALSLSVFFIACVDPYDAGDDGEGEEFEDIALGDFNYVAGQPYQRGWATDGHSEKSSAKGYTAEDFKRAKYLVIELAGTEGLKGGLQLIWGGEPRSAVEAFGVGNAGWVTAPFVDDNGVPVAGKGKLSDDKKVLKLLLSAMPNYDAFIDDSVTELKLCPAYNGAGWEEAFEKCYLQVSSKFTPVTDLDLELPANIYTYATIPLKAVITPADATVQSVSWQIVKKAGSLNPSTEVKFADYTIDVPITDDRYDPALELGDETVSMLVKSAIKAKTPGTVTVRATIKEGKLDSTGKKVDFVQEFDFDVDQSPYPGITLNNSTVISFGPNINDIFDKTDSSTFPKYVVVAVPVGVGNGISIVEGTGADGNPNGKTFKIGLNGGGKANTYPVKDDAKGIDNRSRGTGAISITSSGSDGVVYFIWDLTKWGSVTIPGDYEGDEFTVGESVNIYNRIFEDFGWGLQLVSWDGSSQLGGEYRVYLMKGSVSFTQPTPSANAVAFTGDGTEPSVGWLTNTLPAGLSWEAFEW